MTIPIRSFYDRLLRYRWRGMIQRCYNPNTHYYHRYGGRGIRVCPEWHDFAAYRDWAMRSGFKPSLEIDRRDNDGDYCPTNCRWVTHLVNGRNSRAKTQAEREQCRKIRQVVNEEKRLSSLRKALNKPVICIESGKSFPSVKAAAQAVGKWSGGLTTHLHGRSGSFSRLHWRFV